MPTNSNAYNTRLTDEALEKRFRDTFRSQGGSELVDDLYASGVIVPVVDFTAAAEGSGLRADLQSAWDFTTGNADISNTTTTLISNAGFWKVDLNCSFAIDNVGTRAASLQITDGLGSKVIWKLLNEFNSATQPTIALASEVLIVWLRSGDSLTGTSNNGDVRLSVSYRQIADSSGNFVQPSGFTAS